MVLLLSIISASFLSLNYALIKNRKIPVLDECVILNLFSEGDTVFFKTFDDVGHDRFNIFFAECSVFCAESKSVCNALIAFCNLSSLVNVEDLDLFEAGTCKSFDLLFTVCYTPL
jgi:hypothetical protein